MNADGLILRIVQSVLAAETVVNVDTLTWTPSLGAGVRIVVLLPLVLNATVGRRVPPPTVSERMGGGRRNWEEGARAHTSDWETSRERWGLEEGAGAVSERAEDFGDHAGGEKGAGALSGLAPGLGDDGGGRRALRPRRVGGRAEGTMGVGRRVPGLPASEGEGCGDDRRVSESRASERKGGGRRVQGPADIRKWVRP